MQGSPAQRSGRIGITCYQSALGFISAVGVGVVQFGKRLAKPRRHQRCKVVLRASAFARSRCGIEKTETARRSIPLTRWLPLLQRRDTHLVSLQYADCRDEIEQLQRETGLRVHHWQEAIDDYDATAALVTQLDSVISVCTSLVHLRGALGQRSWVLVPRVPEWRYGLVGDDMPWYPSVKIFRQSAAGEWDSVVARVVDELDHYVEARLA